MKYKTKRDSFFVYLWTALILFINLVFFVPMLFDDIRFDEILIVCVFDFIISTSLIWLAIDISYIIKDEYLLVKGGMFKSKILYKDITKITGSPNIWVGYRLLFSRDAIEIHYKTGLMGSVIISPENKQAFIEELLHKNSSIKVDGII